MPFWVSLKLMGDKCGGFFLNFIIGAAKLCSVSMYNHSDVQTYVPVDQDKHLNLSVMLYILHLILFCPSVPPSSLVTHWKLHLPTKNTFSVNLCSSFFRLSTYLCATFLCSTFLYVHIFPSALFLLNMMLHLSHNFLTSTYNSAKIRTLRWTIF